MSIKSIAFLPTFRGHEGLVVLGAPAHRVQLGCHDVAPEVGFAVLAVAAEAQQQQLATRGDNSGHPVCVRVALIGHFQLHTRLEAALQADLHLGGRETQHTVEYYVVFLQSEFYFGGFPFNHFNQ